MDQDGVNLRKPHNGVMPMQDLPQQRQLAMGVQGIARVLFNDPIDGDTVEGYQTLLSFDRERLYSVLQLLSGMLSDDSETHD